MLTAMTLGLVMRLASTGGGDGHSPAHVFRPASALASWSTPVEVEPGREYRVLVRGGEAVWWVDPAAAAVRRLGPPAVDEQAETEPASWALPEGVKLGERPPGFVGLAPWERGTWLVDGAGQRLWRLAGQGWEGPWPPAEPVADAVALGEAELPLNTPTHPVHPLAVVGEEGRVLRRFGARRRGALPALDAAENTWRLALDPRGRRVVAAPSHAVTTVRGPFAAGAPVEVTVSPHHRSFTLEVRPDAPLIWSLTLLDASGQPLALAVEWSPGPVPLASRSASSTSCRRARCPSPSRPAAVPPSPGRCPTPSPGPPLVVP